MQGVHFTTGCTMHGTTSLFLFAFSGLPQMSKWTKNNLGWTTEMEPVVHYKLPCIWVKSKKAF